MSGEEQAQGDQGSGREQDQASRACGVAAPAGEGAGSGRRQREDVAAEVGEHRRQRAEVAGHVERDLRRPRVPAEQLADEDEMGGAGDGEELGQPLHDAEPHGLGGGHAASGSGGGPEAGIGAAFERRRIPPGRVRCSATRGCQARARALDDFPRRRFGFEPPDDDDAAAGAACSRRAARRSLITMAAAAAMKMVE